MEHNRTGDFTGSVNLKVCHTSVKTDTDKEVSCTSFAMSLISSKLQSAIHSAIPRAGKWRCVHNLIYTVYTQVMLYLHVSYAINFYFLVQSRLVGRLLKACTSARLLRLLWELGSDKLTRDHIWLGPHTRAHASVLGGTGKSRYASVCCCTITD